MRYTLVISSSNDDLAAARRALGFAEAAHASGHSVVQVFFYADGVATASVSDALACWQQLGATTGAELVLCSASAERFAIDEAPDGFVIAGLGALIESGVQTDRVMNFV
jgi:tRNA 2-thiouridine synthesizing protein D